MTEKEVVWPGATEILVRDDAFGPVVEAVGPVRLSPPEDDPFASLARAIVYQQLAGAAASTIHGRFVEVLDGRVTPEAVRTAEDGALRDAGLSRSKLRAIRDLAGKVAAGELELDALEDEPDEVVEERLITVWGIGRWTARMFLLGQLRRPDVWPVGDLGVRAGWARIHDLDDTPGPDELEPRGEPYRPWRSAVAWYCWRAVETLGPAD